MILHIALTKVWAVLNLIGLVYSVVGGLLLAYALTLKPSNFRLVKTGEKELAICLDNRTVVAGYGGPLVVSDDPCPDLKGTGPTAEITANRPRVAHLGLLLIIVGFVLQLPNAVVAIGAKL